VYTAETYDAACRRLGVVQSMGRVGCALDTRRRHSACGGLSPVDYEQLINTVHTIDLDNQAA
jgi:transposase InsO family protein